VEVKEPEPVNILTAMAENESVVKNRNDPGRLAIRFEWQVDVVPWRSVLGFVLTANIVRRSCREHEEHSISVGAGDSSNRTLPSIGVPEVQSENPRHLVDRLRAFLL
jgi:hypothetical protein